MLDGDLSDLDDEFSRADGPVLTAVCMLFTESEEKLQNFAAVNLGLLIYTLARMKSQ
jgi:hypothetical protein